MPRGTKRKVGGSDTVHNDDDVILTVEGAVSKAKGARNKNRKLSALEEYDEDPGRDESRYSLLQTSRLDTRRTR